MRNFTVKFLGILIVLSMIFIFINHIIYSKKMSGYIDNNRKFYKENSSFYVSGNIFKIEKKGNFAYVLFVKIDSVSISKTAIKESNRISGIYDYNSEIAILLSVSKSYDTEFGKKKIAKPLYVRAVCDNEAQIYGFYFPHNELNLTTELSDVDIKNEIGQFLLQQMDTMQNPIKF
ncbi:MAG: hypothetical protein Q4B43_10320 [Bacteroidota bacterium]|nr:hypothetical protein [Bacteroidota bacterium]